MDVRCERCRAQYVFDDEQVTPSGLTVQCTNCGHVFKVKKKELVVTVPVKPDEMDAAPIPATAAAPRPGAAASPAAHGEPREPAREWRVRQTSGNIFTFRELTTLQKWIIEQKVSRDDEISLSGEQWKRLGNIADLASFFQVVEAAERGRAHASAQATPTVTPLPMPAVPLYGVALQTPLYAPPPPAYPPQAPAYPPPPAYAPPAPYVTPAPMPLAPEPRPAPAVDVDLGPAEPISRRDASAGAGRGLRLGVLLVGLLGAAAAAAWTFAPGIFRPAAPAPAPPQAVAVPITIEVPPAAPAASAARAEAPPAEPAAAAPVPAPEPVAEPAVQPPPEPIVKAVVAKPAPRGPKALLADAARLRQKGEFERALDLYGRVAGDDPENVDALTGRGLCYLDLETYPPAEASFQAALALRPEEPDALLGLAETYRWQGKKADAIRYYERYLAAHPTGDEVAVARNALEELRK